MTLKPYVCYRTYAYGKQADTATVGEKCCYSSSALVFPRFSRDFRRVIGL